MSVLTIEVGGEYVVVPGGQGVFRECAGCGQAFKVYQRSTKRGTRCCPTCNGIRYGTKRAPGRARAYTITEEGRAALREAGL